MPFLAGEVVWAVRHEMARTIEDFLARRRRALLLDAKASIEMAPKVADIMAEELEQDDSWKAAQVRAYRKMALRYLPEIG
jgi:glycerol-3-phosphate dehydrogenase